MGNFAGRCILVTGASGGIGKSVTDLLLSLGARVISIDKAPAATEYKDSNYRHIQADLTNNSDLERIVQEAEGEKPDALVALAGIVVSGNLTEQSDADVERVIHLNLTSQINLSKRIVSNWLTRKTKGNIVFVSSWVDHVPWPGITPYSASKAGLVALCRGIAREYAKNGIRANLIAPGIVDVGMAAKQWREEPDYQARAKRAIPLGRLQYPDEVAKGIAFLLSDDSSYMTGSTLLMDGGASLYPLDPEDAL
ncbi:MAG: SDR family oxidoreductase [Actinobacteria bacterium]|nr:SDR family oxidoreductase [Actinomycetota bacterium]